MADYLTGRRRVANTFDPNAEAPLPMPMPSPLPGTGPFYTGNTSVSALPFRETPVRVQPPAAPAPIQNPAWYNNPNPVGSRPLPAGGGAPPLRAISVPQSGNAHFYGSHGDIGYQRFPNGRIAPIPRAMTRRDLTGDVARFAGGLLGSGVGSMAGGVGGLVGGQAGRMGGSALSRYLNRLWARRNSARMPDTLTRDQIRGAGVRLPAAHPNDPDIRNQQAGGNLGRGMEGTPYDRTVTTPGQFAASQRGNQVWNDMRNPSVGPAIPDFPDHIYHGDDTHEGRHARPLGRVTVSNPGYSTTREAMDKRGGVLGGGGRNAPVAEMSFLERLQAARGIQPAPVGPRVNNANGLLPWVGDPATAVQGPSASAALLRRYQRTGR